MQVTHCWQTGYCLLLVRLLLPNVLLLRCRSVGRSTPRLLCMSWKLLRLLVGSLILLRIRSALLRKEGMLLLLGLGIGRLLLLGLGIGRLLLLGLGIGRLLLLGLGIERLLLLGLRIGRLLLLGEMAEILLLSMLGRMSDLNFSIRWSLPVSRRYSLSPKVALCV